MAHDCSPSVYPRPCGEQTYYLRFATYDAGLSPPVRGTVKSRQDVSLPCRFIPARAGNRWPAATLRPPRSVYPRPCGEQEAANRLARIFDGLSPPVRGTAFGDAGLAPDERFIPARAGNRRGWPTSAPGTAVYPRPCGEQRFHRCECAGSCGLSPPVRGTGNGTTWDDSGSRFIPARAGNRLLGESAADIKTVYPRPCGEQAPRITRCLTGRGLSPPVRGTGRAGQLSLCCSRFIPARAGNRRTT